MRTLIISAAAAVAITQGAFAQTYRPRNTEDNRSYRHEDAWERWQRIDRDNLTAQQQRLDIQQQQLDQMMTLIRLMNELDRKQ
jgi:hypothetical protein